ncbi:7384_t:CDS:2, partial [Acaulospora morrowiae]
LYANEQDTVTVGQDLFKIELGDAATAGPDATASKEGEVVKPEQKQEFKEEIKDEKKETTSPPSPEPSPFQSEPKPAVTTSPPEPKPAATSPTPEQSLPPRKADVLYGEREERQIKMNRMRLRIAERLKESQNTAASLTTFNEIDMSNIIELRNTYKDVIIKKHGIKLGFMSAFVKASVFALQEIPAVNASISESGDTILYRDYVDMSVAVATPKGLVTPVVRNVHLLSFIEIEKAIAELGQK